METASLVSLKNVELNFRNKIHDDDFELRLVGKKLYTLHLLAKMFNFPTHANKLI